MTEVVKVWNTPYGPITQRKIFANLFAEVIRRGRCILCGACIAVCPINALILSNEMPRLLGACIRCGYCYYACPLTTDEEFKGFDDKKYVDKLVFNEVRSEVFGVFKKIYVVERVKDDNACPDEAIARKILAYGLKRGFFDIVIFSGYGEPANKYLISTVGRWEAKPMYVFNYNMINEARLKPLTPGAPYIGLRGAIEEYVAGFYPGSRTVRVALFLNPMQVRAIHRMKNTKIQFRKLTKTVVFTVSTFSRPFYSYSLLKKILAKDGIDIDSIEDWRFELDGLSILYKSEWRKYSYDSLKEAYYKGYMSIDDLTGEYADLSIGILSDIDGVVMICRSKRAVKLVEEAIRDNILKKVDISLDEVLDKLKSLYGGRAL